MSLSAFENLSKVYVNITRTHGCWVLVTIAHEVVPALGATSAFGLVAPHVGATS